MSRLALFLSTLALAGTEVLGQSPAIEWSHPVVSPDGRYVVVTSRRDGAPDLYVTTADGTSPVRLTNSAEPEGVAGWSADGARVLYAVFRNDSAFIYAVNRDGSNQTELGHVPGRAVRVTPDQSTVIAGVGPWPTMQLVVSSLDGSRPRQVTAGDGAFWCHSLSRDGRRIATTRADSGKLQVWVLNADGTGARQVTHFPRSDGGPQCPSWSADGKRLAVQSAVPDARDSTKQVGHVWVVDVASGAATKVSPHSEPYLDETPSWFPDGKRLAFQSNRSGRWLVYVVNIDGTGLRPLVVSH